MVPQDAPLASELVLDVLGKRGQTRTRPRRRSEAVSTDSSADGDRGDGTSPLQRHRIEEVAAVAASMRTKAAVMLVAPSRAAERAVAATAVESCGRGAKMQQGGLS